MKATFTHLAAIAATLAVAAGCAVTGPQADPRPSHRFAGGPQFNGQVTLAGGKYEHDIDSSFEDKTDAGFLGLLAEASTTSGFGGGVSLEIINSDDDLFENQATSASQATTVEVAPYFLYRVRGGDRFRMPVRFGPWIHSLTLDDQGSSDSITWVSVGLRLAVEPEVVLARNENFEFSLFTALSLAGGGTRIDVDTAVVDDEFDSESGAFGLEVGPRFRWSHFRASFSFLHRSLAVDESDPENNIVVLGFDDSFNGLALSFGGEF